MSPAKHSAICAQIQQLHQAKESKLLARIEKLEAQRTWVYLTDEEIEARAINFYNPEMYKRAVLWAQEKLKERNQ